MAKVIRGREGPSLRHSVVCLKGEAEIADRLPGGTEIHCLHSWPNKVRLPERLALGLIRSCFITRFLANVAVSGCAYAAVKGDGGAAPAGQSTQGDRR